MAGMGLPQPEPGATEDDLLGRWRPVILNGVPLEPTARISDSSASVRWTGGLRFDREPHLGHIPGQSPALRWAGYDGCNWCSGFLHLQPTGAFTTSHDATTLRGCSGWDPSAFSMVTAVMTAARLSLDGDTLTFLDATGVVLGVFERRSAGSGESAINHSPE